MIFKSKELVNDIPLWSVDTDTQTVMHIHPRTLQIEEHKFYRDFIRYHLHFCENYHPSRLQRLVDNGEIYQYLTELETKVLDAVDSQEELFKADSIEYQIALDKGDLVAVGAIGNAITQQARESVFETMIYV